MRVVLQRIGVEAGTVGQEHQGYDAKPIKIGNGAEQDENAEQRREGEGLGTQQLLGLWRQTERCMEMGTCYNTR